MVDSRRPVETTTFRSWMHEVDQRLIKICGMSSHDLPDYTYRDSFDDGADPWEVANEVLLENDYPFLVE